MDEIATKAKVAKGTLYYNYASKAQLFTATVVDGIEEIISEIKKELESDLPFKLHFRKLIECHIVLYLKYRISSIW